MSARQSAEVTRALRLIANGSTPYAAAKKVGVQLSTIYRAQRRNGTPAAPTPRSVMLDALRQIVEATSHPMNMARIEIIARDAIAFADPPAEVEAPKVTG